MYNIFYYMKSQKFVINNYFYFFLLLFFSYFIILLFYYFHTFLLHCTTTIFSFPTHTYIYFLLFLFFLFFCTFSRDLKPENLLLNSVEDDANIKIADFGFAVECSDSSLTTRCGTPGTFLRRKKNLGKTQILQFQNILVN